MSQLTLLLKEDVTELKKHLSELNEKIKKLEENNQAISQLQMTNDAIEVIVKLDEKLKWYREATNEIIQYEKDDIKTMDAKITKIEYKIQVLNKQLQVADEVILRARSAIAWYNP